MVASFATAMACLQAAEHAAALVATDHIAAHALPLWCQTVAGCVAVAATGASTWLSYRGSRIVVRHLRLSAPLEQFRLPRGFSARDHTLSP